LPNRFRNKYRIKSTRLQNWNYSWNAAYYVTICVNNRECYFGEIVEGQMNLSEIGEIVKSEWLKSPDIRPDMNIELKPNDLNDNVSNQDNMETIGRDAINRVSTLSNKFGGITGKNNPMINNNLSRIIRWYKGRVTFETRQIYSGFAWQPRFFDHVIRNDESLNKIRCM